MVHIEFNLKLLHLCISMINVDIIFQLTLPRHFSLLFGTCLCSRTDTKRHNLRSVCPLSVLREIMCIRIPRLLYSVKITDNSIIFSTY